MGRQTIHDREFAGLRLDSVGQCSGDLTVLRQRGERNLLDPDGEQHLPDSAPAASVTEAGRAPG